MDRAELLIPQEASPSVALQPLAPAIITREGHCTTKRFLKFFAATIRNRHTREAYMRAVGHFLSWCEGRGLDLHGIEPLAVAAYIERHPRRKLLRPATGAAPATSDAKAGAAGVEGGGRADGESGLAPLTDFHNRTYTAISADLIPEKKYC